jgi:hypothetical protein
LDIKKDKKRSTTAGVNKILTSSKGDVKIVSKNKNVSSYHMTDLSKEHFHFSNITDIIKIQNNYKR